MKFLALLIALGLFLYWPPVQWLQRDAWLQQLGRRLADTGWRAELQVGLIVLLPVLLLYGLQQLLADLALGLPALALAVLVLLYSFGRGDFAALLEQYRHHCQHSDMEGTRQFALDSFGRAGAARDLDNPEQLHRWVKERICYLGYQGRFAVVFYFVLLGPPAALAYRLLQLMAEQRVMAEQQLLAEQRHSEPVGALPGAPHDAADADSDSDGDGDAAAPGRDWLVGVLYWIDWLPSRLLLGSFALTGDWIGSRPQLMASMRDTRTAIPETLAAGAHAALGLKPTVFSDNGAAAAQDEISAWEVGELQGLFGRSTIAWVVVLALPTLLL